jgi:long-subunit acyl-CoA synthetase (AMP-forming)
MTPAQQPPRIAHLLEEQRRTKSPTAIALRHKRRGLWHALTWQELAAEVAGAGQTWQDAGLQPGDPVVVLGGDGVRTLLTLLALDQAGARVTLLDPADDDVRQRLRAARARFAFVAGDDALGILDDTGPTTLERIVREDPRSAAHPRGRASDPGALDDNAVMLLLDGLATPAGGLVLERWLTDGFTLAIGESSDGGRASDTAHAELGEVTPSLLFASSAFYERLWARTSARLGAPTGLRQRLLAAARTPGIVAVLARLLVVRPLASRLGLDRVSRAFVIGGPLPPAASAFFALLGLPLASASLRAAVSSASSVELFATSARQGVG